MARPFDFGKNQYAKHHRDPSADQQTRHILADDLLQHYGAKPENYREWATDGNYRMGSAATNTRDRMLDRHIVGEAFSDAGRASGYDAQYLARGTKNTPGMSYSQQINALGARFDAAKQGYATTGEHKYLMIQKDIRSIADTHLDADLRGFRLSKK